jgi:PKD repeat protein
METPDIDVSTLTSPALEFYLRSENSNTPNDNNTIIVDIWDGAAWNDSVLVFQDDSTDWFHIYIPLNNIIFTGPMRARITMDETTTTGSSFYNDILIDDISVIEDTSNVVQVLCDNFDGYTVGGLAAQSTAWESWGGGAEDADVVASPTFSGAGAMRIHETGANGVSDIVYQMGDLTTGSHEVSFYFNVPTANGSYFNLMHDYDGGTAPVFAIEVLFDGTNGTGVVDYGSSGGGNIANFSFTPGTWNRMQIIVDLDADQAEMLVNGFSVGTWTWSDGQGGVYESLGGIDFYSFAPGALTSLMYVDEFCFGDYVPACLVTTQPTGSDVDGCEGQATTLTATAGDTSNFVVWLDNSGQVLATGSNYTIDSLTATTTANAVDATELGASDHVGPLPSIATDGFGNFTNGTFITVYNTVRVDSMLIKSDGAVDMGVNFWSDVPSNGGVLLQTSASASLPAAGEHQIPVNITLQPGTYFANVRYDGGAGQLFRATGGATFPYVLPDLISLDSINFVNQQRFYYLFDWVVTPVCLGTQPTALTMNLVDAPSAAYTPTTTAGSCEVSFDASASVGDSYAWDFGDGSGASGATPTHTYAASGTYDVTLVVTNTCGNDTVVQQVTVDCIGLREDFLSSLNAYPNPTTDVLNIVFELQNRQDVQVRLMNSLGQIVYGEDLEAFSGVYEHQLSLENQAKGVYMLQVTTANGTKTMRVTLQ